VTYVTSFNKMLSMLTPHFSAVTSTLKKQQIPNPKCTSTIGTLRSHLLNDGNLDSQSLGSQQPTLHDRSQ
jgi:hypothetical protein